MRTLLSQQTTGKDVDVFVALERRLVLVLSSVVWQCIASMPCLPSLARVNFTLDDLDAVSPAYDHFVACVTECSDRYGLKGACVDTPNLQYFQYERVPQLVSAHTPMVRAYEFTVYTYCGPPVLVRVYRYCGSCHL